MASIVPRLLRTSAFLFVATVPALAAQAPKPEPGKPYQYWDVEDVDSAARRVYFRNDSPNPITITQLMVTTCVNTRQNCGTYPANMVVPPGKTVMAFKIERFDKKLGWRFGYSFRTSAPPTATVGAPQGLTTIGAPGGSSRVVMRMTTVDSLLPLLPAPITNGRCVMVKVADLPAGHRALMMVFGSGPGPAARRVMVRLDGNGSPYEYTDIRQQMVDSLQTIQQSQISIDFIRQSVQLLETTGPAMTAASRATGAGLLTAESLGKPGEMIARLQKECGAT